MTPPKRRRSHGAEHPSTTRVLEQSELIWMYRLDDGFVAEIDKLLELVRKSASEQRVAAAVEVAIRRYGLDRLRPEGELAVGFVRILMRGPNEPLDPESVVFMLAHGEEPAPVDSAVGSLDIRVQGNWDPTEERMADARKRLKDVFAARLEDQLERVARAAESQGFVFLDTRPMYERDLWCTSHT